MKKLVFILAIGILLSCFVAAGVTNVNSSINSNYTIGQNLTGNITLNLTNIPYNSYILTSYGQNISLKDLLKMQTGFEKGVNYNCIPNNCNPYYKIVPGSISTSKSFGLAKGESKTIGLIIDGSKITGISGDVVFSVSSDAPESDAPQLSAEMLNGSNWLTEWHSYKWSGHLSNQAFVGCYNSSYSSQQVNLGATAYCENIVLSKAPLIQLGTTISGSGTSGITMYINDSYGNLVGSCTLPSGTYSNNELKCVAKKSGINTTITHYGNYLVCIKIDSESGNNYKINIESTPPVCGFLSNTPNNYVADYNLFARPGTYAPVVGFTLSGASLPLNSIVSTDLKDVYNNDCSKGCIVPVRFNASSDQSISVYDLSIKAGTPIGTVTFNNISNISMDPSVVLNTNGLQTLSLDAANFSIGSQYGNNPLEIFLDNGTNKITLFSGEINIRKVPRVISLNPNVVVAGIPSNFTAKVDTFGANTTIKSYMWNFGDNKSGSVVTTSTNKTSYTYGRTGTFNVSVKITNEQGISSSQNFTVTASTPKDAVNILLGQKIYDYKKLNDLISKYSSFTQKVLKSALNLDNLSTELTNLQGANATASSDSKYVGIVKQLLELNIPKVGETTSADNIPFIPLNSSINLDELKSIGGGTYASNRTNDYLNAIIGWDLSNASIKISYKRFSSIYGSSAEPLLDIVTLQVNSQEDSYLMIRKLGNMQFNNPPTQTPSGDFYYFPLSAGSTQTISFSTTELASPLNAPLFVAPSLENLPLPKPLSNEPSNKWIWLVFIMLGIFVGGFVIYIIVGKWYQKRYESYLFQNKNDLYNIVTYIHTAKSKGAKDSDIEKNLRNSKWNSEQISYVMKRYVGKKVGLLGFAIRGNRPKSKHKR